MKNKIILLVLLSSTVFKSLCGDLSLTNLSFKYRYQLETNWDTATNYNVVYAKYSDTNTQFQTESYQLIPLNYYWFGDVYSNNILDTYVNNKKEISEIVDSKIIGIIHITWKDTRIYKTNFIDYNNPPAHPTDDNEWYTKIPVGSYFGPINNTYYKQPVHLQ